MTVKATRRTTCRLCDSPKVERVVELAPIPLSENYTTDPETAKQAERFPVDVYMCAECGHVQQLDVIDPEYLWASYTYYSGEAKGMPEHFRQMAERMLAAAAPPPGSLVIDIGSNDGSLLKPFKERGLRVLGVDPAKAAAERAIAAGVPTEIALMSLPLAERIRAVHGPAQIVSAFNVFAHADDLGAMADCVRILLAPDGLFFFEAQYLAGALIAYAIYDPLAPTWRITATRLDEQRVRLDLRMKRLATGGEGEARRIFRRNAEQLVAEGGFVSYEVLRYEEGIESTRPFAHRFASGEIRLARSETWPEIDL